MAQPPWRRHLAQIRRVVVGVDFTDASLAAARWAAACLAPDAEIILVHAIPGASVPGFLRPYLPQQDEIAAAIGPPVHGALRGLANLVDRDRTGVLLATGTPADALVRVADDLSADLVCVGRGRHRRGSARFGATTPHRLLARTCLPTLVVPVGLPLTIERIVVGADEHAGRELIDAACQFAARFEASVDALHVIAPDVEHVVSAMKVASDAAEGLSASIALRALSEATNGGHGEWVTDRAYEWLAALLARVDRGADRARAVIGRGDAGSEIIRHARATSADLIVVARTAGSGSFGHTARELSPGSTARLVTWAAPCSVLVMPTVSASHFPLPPAPPRARGRSRAVDADTVVLRQRDGANAGGFPPAA